MKKVYHLLQKREESQIRSKFKNEISSNQIEEREFVESNWRTRIRRIKLKNENSSNQIEGMTVIKRTVF